MARTAAVPASLQRARQRREQNRLLLSSPDECCARLDLALEWLRIAAAAAEHRGCTDSQAKDRALARRAAIRAEAARLVQATADEVDTLVPGSYRPSPDRRRIRTASAQAGGAKAALDLARAWLMLASSRARRYERRDGGLARRQAGVIKDAAVPRITELAEEMDADDFGS